MPALWRNDELANKFGVVFSLLEDLRHRLDNSQYMEQMDVLLYTDGESEVMELLQASITGSIVDPCPF